MPPSLAVSNTKINLLLYSAYTGTPTLVTPILLDVSRVNNEHVSFTQITGLLGTKCERMVRAGGGAISTLFPLGKNKNHIMIYICLKG